LAEVDWNRRYKEGFYDGLAKPHDLLARFWPAIRGPRVIDVAMGNGRDLLFLAEKGFSGFGLEQSTEAIRIAAKASAGKEKGLAMVRGDAALFPFKEGVADGALVFYFLIRSIMGDLAATLKRGGVLIYETFLKRQNEIDRWRNPEYLLEDGELLSWFRGFDLLFYEEGVSFDGGKRRATAKFVGRKR
jgi:tellurite methyltransferase